MNTPHLRRCILVNNDYYLWLPLSIEAGTHPTAFTNRNWANILVCRTNEVYLGNHSYIFICLPYDVQIKGNGIAKSRKETYVWK